MLTDSSSTTKFRGFFYPQTRTLANWKYELGDPDFISEGSESSYGKITFWGKDVIIFPLTMTLGHGSTKRYARENPGFSYIVLLPSFLG